MKRGAILLVSAAAAFVLGGCAGIDVTSVATIAAKGVPKAVQASRPINDSEEYYVGRAVGARILAQQSLRQDPELTRYVNEVGQTVARKSARPQTFKGYHFAVLDTQEPNAFACPGGLILITRGLLQTCESEDELAAVLAHEVSHVANKDGINSISQARWTEVLTTMGTEAARQYAGAAGSLVSLFEGSIDDVFKTIVVSGYSRSAEEAADAAAVQTLRQAGYDPGAVASLLDKMMAKEKGAPGGMFKTHPPTADRLAKVKALVGEGKAPEKEVAARTQRFQKYKI
ncbi:MAG: peptidase M48 [Deltaproteobacteria bacterium]|nr:peptidase M48 [Deltaproteobacteria bacterium]